MREAREGVREGRERVGEGRVGRGREGCEEGFGGREI